MSEPTRPQRAADATRAARRAYLSDQSGALSNSGTTRHDPRRSVCSRSIPKHHDGVQFIAGGPFVRESNSSITQGQQGAASRSTSTGYRRSPHLSGERSAHGGIEMTHVPFGAAGPSHERPCRARSADVQQICRAVTCARFKQEPFAGLGITRPGASRLAPDIRRRRGRCRLRGGHLVGRVAPARTRRL